MGLGRVMLRDGDASGPVGPLVNLGNGNKVNAAAAGGGKWADRGCFGTTWKKGLVYGVGGAYIEMLGLLRSRYALCESGMTVNLGLVFPSLMNFLKVGFATGHLPTAHRLTQSGAS